MITNTTVNTIEMLTAVAGVSASNLEVTVSRIRQENRFVSPVRQEPASSRATSRY